MYGRRRARVLLAVLVLVSLVLITIDFRTPQGEGPLDRAREFVTTAFGPVQDGLGSLVRPIGNAFTDVGDLFSLRAENEQLRERIERLENRTESIAEIERENAELRELLGMQQRHDFDVVVARTVAFGPSNFEWTITIDAGADQGVERDMVVVNGDGLVGRVIQVTPSASRVLLAIDPNFSAAVRVTRTGAVGTLDGRGGGLMRLETLNPEADLVRGDEVVTAAYSNGVFPPGIPIGTIDSIGETTSVLTRDVGVRPFVDFSRLNHVMVVIHDPIAELPEIVIDPSIPIVPPDPIPSPTPSPGSSPSPGASPSPGSTP